MPVHSVTEPGPAPGTEAAVAALYRRSPKTFKGARDDLATRLEEIGDELGAARVRRLAVPTTAAWWVNQLADRWPQELDSLLELGPQLREAASSRDGARLTELDRVRRVRTDALLSLLWHYGAQEDLPSVPSGQPGGGAAASGPSTQGPSGTARSGKEKPGTDAEASDADASRTDASDADDSDADALGAGTLDPGPATGSAGSTRHRKPSTEDLTLVLETVTAAVLDEAAAQLVRSGQTTRPLTDTDLSLLPAREPDEDPMPAPVALPRATPALAGRHDALTVATAAVVDAENRVAAAAETVASLVSMLEGQDAELAELARARDSTEARLRTWRRTLTETERELALARERLDGLT